jgi:hypothetical protein
MTFIQLKKELKTLPFLNNPIQNRAYSLLDDIIRWTPEESITKSMEDLIINCFAIISIYGFNARDYSYIKSELDKAGWNSQNKGTK